MISSLRITDLQSLQTKVASASAKYDLACEQARQEKQALSKTKQKVTDCEEAQRLVQDVAQAIQNRIHIQISSVVTKCLRTIFGEDAYEFKVDFQKARGKTEANLLFTKDGKEIDPLSASGGGVVDVAAFALRLACIMLSRPNKRRLIVADEPMKFLNGRKYQKRVGQLLQELADELDFQMIIATDDDWLKIGKVVEL